MSDAITLDKVSFAYGKTKALNDLSLSIASNRFTALLGSNGAGKSTIFNLIATLLLPDQGEVRIQGHSTKSARINALKEMGMVFQQSTLDLELSIAQNLRYYIGLHHLEVDEDYYSSLLQSLELEAQQNKKARELSGGFRRRVEIARALLGRPSLLILDEPTVGLDPASKTLITEYAHDLAHQGVSVLWITHLLDELKDDDEVILLSKGEVVEEGRFAKLGGAEALAGRYSRERPAL